MKRLLTLCSILLLAFFLTSLVANAEEAAITKEKLTGIWWGTVVGEAHGGDPSERLHWVTERKADGSFRYQEYWADHEKKIYYADTPATGVWEIKGGKLLQYITPATGEVGRKEVRLEGGKIRWEIKYPDGAAEITVKCWEEPAKEFAPQLPKDYRKVTREEFDRRYRKPGEQSPPKDAEIHQGGFIFTEEEGSARPQSGSPK